MSQPRALRLTSASAATDAAWLAAADVATIAAGLCVDYRLIGGIAITLLVHHHQVDHLVPARETADADLGVGFDVLSDDALPEALRRAGYSAEESNRFARDDDHGRRRVIDVLAPSYLGRLLTNQSHGAIVVDEVPGLAEALHLAPVRVSVTAALTDATDVDVTLHLPDARAALILKAYAYRGRWSHRDALDIWRLLEAASQAGHRAADWPPGLGARDAAQILHEFFAAPAATGPKAATRDPSAQARIRALVHQVVPPPTP